MNGARMNLLFPDIFHRQLETTGQNLSEQNDILPSVWDQRTHTEQTDGDSAAKGNETTTNRGLGDEEGKQRG